MTDYLKVLFADDNSSTTWHMKKELDAEGIEVIIAENGDEAVELCAQHRPDIAFVDLIMPRLGGEQVLDQIKEICPQTKVIIMSAVFGGDDVLFRLFVLSIMEKGAAGFLIKPTTPARVLMKIRELFSNQY